MPSNQLPPRRLALFGSNQVERNGGLCWKYKIAKLFLFVVLPQILLMNKEINPAELDFLLRYPVQPGVASPVDFLSNHSWGGIKVGRKAEMAALLKCHDSRDQMNS